MGAVISRAATGDDATQRRAGRASTGISVLDVVHRESASEILNATMKTTLFALRVFLALTILTGIVYPLAVTAISRLLFPNAAAGSLVRIGDRILGTMLLAQKTEGPRYFWPRASAADFATVASGASNQGPASAALKTAIAERRAKFGADAPADLLTSSGSGLDPHLSPEAAKYQAARVASARGLPEEMIDALIDQESEGPQFGFLGEPRVNVLTLNCALDRAQ